MPAPAPVPVPVPVPTPTPTPTPVPTPVPVPPPAPSPTALLNTFGLGINCHEANYYSAPWVFTDAWKQASAWTADAWGFYAGAPGRDGALSVLSWDGTGTLTPEGTNLTFPSANRVQFNPPANRHFTVRRVGDVSNVRLVRVADATVTSLFHPLYIANLRNFKVTRFLEIADVNSSTTSAWAGRVTGDRIVSGLGMSYENMLAVCAEANTVPWFCVPHLATDDYVRQLAQLIAARRPTGQVIIEWSNEVWNGAFTQQQYAQAQGVALGLDTNAFAACLRYQARRSREIWAIMGPILGSRMLRVLGGQHAGPSNSGLLLSAVGAGGCDALATAPYFQSMSGVPAINTLTVQQKARADAAGVPLIAYEGGPHMPLYATNATAGIYEATRALLDGWRAAGGGLFCYFADCYRPHSTWGAWGALEEQNQPLAQAAKQRALLDSIAQP